MSEKVVHKIQSFVRRSGRLTLGQRTGLIDLWPQFGVDIPSGIIDLNSLFKKIQPITLEIGFGNGDSLLEMAINAPDQNFLGIEVYEAGIGRLINEANKHQLSNLKIIKADAVEVLEHHIKDDSFDTFQLFFPDPWHKKKHHKRRIIQTDFLDLISNKLQDGGTMHMATDWENYAEYMMVTLEKHPHFKNAMSAHKYSLRPEHRPITKFERRGERLGHGVWDLIFINEK
ncbi:MAG: tRNA (guanosine(46)-N7)-methyltransferase TrmB [Candidatus Thioglobus sp.]|nr:MAG: tRNA (guanosine(46)-N7)-methyltransferase TrmB [Candidatus Thioglobus sp.]